MALVGLLYGALFAIVRRADRILKKQYVDLLTNGQRIEVKNAALEYEIAEREKAEATLRKTHESLEQRVRERTAELRENERYLLMARQQAEAASRAKSEFLAAMSHELRTPLNAIIGFSEIIKGESFGPIGSAKYSEYASDIHTSGHHLLGLINDILDLSKVESGMDELDQEDIEVPRIVESASKLVRQRADAKGVELALRMPRDLPALRADKRKLTQILVNLLSNAVKFTEDGGKVTLEVRWGADSGYVFQIVDTGIGIAAEDIPKALSRFGQVDGNLNRRYEGTGLGLPLTKALAEQHGAALDLRSRVGRGTSVTVRFPAQRIVSPPGDARSLDAGSRRAG